MYRYKRLTNSPSLGNEGQEGYYLTPAHTGSAPYIHSDFGLVKTAISILYFSFLCPLFRGGYLGLSWGFPGGYLGVRRGTPHQTPSKPPGNSMLIPFLQRTGITEYKSKQLTDPIKKRLLITFLKTQHNPILISFVDL